MMLKHCELFYFILFFYVKAVKNDDTPFDNCIDIKSLGNPKLIVYADWPFKVNCDSIAVGSNETLDQCYATLSGMQSKPASESITLFGSSPSETSITLTKIVDNSLCFNDSMVVDVRSLPTRSCFDNVNYYVTRDINVIHKRVVEGETFLLDCVPAPNAGDEKILPPALPSKDYKTTWRYTGRSNDTSLKNKNACEDFLLDAKPYQLRVEEHPDRPPSLRVYTANVLHSGIYSCEILYKNQTAFITHYSICVENMATHSQPVVMCNEEIEFFEEETKSIKCEVQSSNLKISSGEMEVEWKKVLESSGNEDLCKSIYSDSGNQSSPSFKDSRITCGEDEFTNIGVKCFRYFKGFDDLSKYYDKNAFKVYLQIKNLKKSDAGKYTVKLKYLDKWSETTEIHLKFNPTRDLQRLVAGLMCVLVILAGIFIAMFFIWYNWIQILLFIRRHLGKYDEDDKEFVAILSYIYSDEVSESTRSKTLKIVRCIREKMEDLNYKFYDSHEHFLEGSSVERLLRCLNDSHRMIIVLTDAYVDGRWSRFEAQQGLINMLKNKTKLIVVRTPGAKRELDKLWKKKDDFTNELKEAIKASRNIYWKEKMSDERFKDHIQYALPNLKRSPTDSTQSLHIVSRRYFNMSSVASTQPLYKATSIDSLHSAQFQASTNDLV